MKTKTARQTAGARMVATYAIQDVGRHMNKEKESRYLDAEKRRYRHSGMLKKA